MISPVLSIYQNNLNLFHPSCLFLTLHGPSLLFFPSGASFYVVSFDVNVLSFIVIRLITTQEKSANQRFTGRPPPALFTKFCGKLSVHLYSKIGVTHSLEEFAR